MDQLNIIPLFQVDAFTDRTFSGNPAAVCPIHEWLPDSWLQSVANENNLSETAFIVKKGSDYDIRWFTPNMEIDLCGHATLASAHVAFEHLGYEEEEIRFNSKSGLLKVVKNGDFLIMNFPSRPPESSDTPEELVKGLGAAPMETLKSRDYLALFNSEEEILALQPDFNILSKVDSLGIIVTSKGDGSDFVSRFFAPRAGVDEDPVTGSAHSTLIPYWAAKLNKKKLHAFQVSKRRGELFCELHEDRVLISGKAVTYLQGFIRG